MFSQYSPSMVGEQGNRTSETRSATPPQSYWWKRIQNSNTRLQETSGSLNCAEKFTSLVSCHRGYGSVAFYAVFSLFILTFLYAIWKIVSAHSRSGRRPGSGNSTSIAKLSPTAHAPTTYINTYAWLHKENIVTHFNPSLKSSYSPLDNPTPVNLYPPERQKHSKVPSVIDKDFPTRGRAILENTSPTWTSPSRATEPLYNYYSGPYKSIQPTSNNPPPYPTLPYPSVVNPLFPSAQYPEGFNPYPRPPFVSDLNNNRRFRFEYGLPNSSPFNYNSNSPGIFNERTSIMPPVANTSNIPTDYSLPVDKNTPPQGYYDNNYYRVDQLQIEGALPTSPSPLISFLKETSENNHNSRPKARKKRKRITAKRKTRRHKKRKQSQIQNHVKNVKNRKAKHHVKSIISHRKKFQEKWRKGRKPHLQQYKKMQHFRAHFKSARSRIPRYHRKVTHIKKSLQFKNSKTRHHEKSRTHLHRIYDHHRKKAHIHHTYSRRPHRVLNFRLYRLYRRHHSVHDEIRGKWSVSRHRVRTCKIVDQFSTRGLVKMTRTKGKNRYLHTLLICRPVRLKMKKGVHRHSYPVKYAQLCRKKWFITKAFIFVNRVSKSQEFPRYNVKICTPSYAHANQLLSAKNEESKVWNISKEALLKMKTEDAENMNARTSSVTDGHKHHPRKKKVKKHRKSKRRHKSLKRKNQHHKKRRKHLKHKTKAGKRLKLHEKERRKLEKVQKKQKVHHNLRPNKATKRKKTFSKSKGRYMDLEHDFYGKLLHVLKLAKMYDRKKANRTKGDDVFDSLEAVLLQNQTTTNVPLGKKKPTVKPSTIKTVTTPSKHHLNHENSQNSSTRDNKVHSQDNVHLTDENSQNNSKHNKGDSQDNIQRLLAKILPAVIKNLHGDAAVSHLTKTKVTTKPTIKVTTIQKTTPTTQMTTSTTKSSKDNFEELMKTFLPLFLKKTQSLNSKGVKQKPEKKQAPVQPKQSPSVTVTRKVKAKIDLKTLLSRMGVDNLVSESLSNKNLAKTATITAQPTAKPTSKLIVAPVKSTVVPKTSIHPPITRPKPTSAVTTIQLPGQLRQPDVSHQLESSMGAKPTLFQTKTAVSSPQMPSVSLSAPPATPSSALPPVPTALFSPGSPPGLSSQPAFSPQVNGDNTSPFLPPVNSDPYSRSILCFGDSLTSGFYNHGKNFHPYSQTLSRLLNSDRRLRYYVKTSGKVREMAHGSMARRLPQILGNSSRFDWVIILGGTNDVAHVKNFGDDDSFMNQLINVWKPRIVRDIEVLHDTAHKYGARTILLTIPETAYEAWPNFKTLWIMRRGINQDLREYARRSQGNTVLCDLALKLPRHSISPQAQAILWNDHLHLTPYGYDKMAEIIYQCLKPYLSK